MPAVRVPNERLAEELRASRGMVATAARNLGLSRACVNLRIHNSPALQEVLKDARELVTDRAESKLFEMIEAGEAWAVCFYLKTRGKDRGYVERQEHSGPDGGPITIREVVVNVPAESAPSLDGDG